MLVAGRIVEGDEAAHAAQLRFLAGADMDAVAEPVEFGGRQFQIVALGHLERDGLVGRRAREIAQRVFALVGLEIDACPSTDA